MWRHTCFSRSSIMALVTPLPFFLSFCSPWMPSVSSSCFAFLQGTVTGHVAQATVTACTARGSTSCWHAMSLWVLVAGAGAGAVAAAAAGQVNRGHYCRSLPGLVLLCRRRIPDVCIACCYDGSVLLSDHLLSLLQAGQIYGHEACGMARPVVLTLLELPSRPCACVNMPPACYSIDTATAYTSATSTASKVPPCSGLLLVHPGGRARLERGHHHWCSVACPWACHTSHTCCMWGMAA